MSFYADKVTIFDMAAGIYGQTDFNVAWHGVASLEYGFSVYHIIESTQSFLSEHGSASSEENLLNRRYSGYVSYAHPFALESDQYSAFSVRNGRCAVGYAEFTIRSLLGGRTFRTDRSGGPGRSIRRIAGRYLVSTFRSEYSGRT